MEKTTMRKIREIIRLFVTTDLSRRKIARSLNLSRPVVSQFITDFQSSALSPEDIQKMNDDDLAKILQSRKKNESEKYKILSDQFEYFAKELKRKHVTLKILWEEYLANHPDGYRLAQFYYHFKVWKNCSELTMHMDHKAGDKMFVDFAGDKLFFLDKAADKKIDVFVFIAILGASGLTYVEGFLNEKKQSWITGTENAFWYFGGVTAAIVPDCAKAVVSLANKYEPDINPEYADFASHYNTVVVPARPGEPKDKASVENAVRIVYRWIYARLRNRIFYSLAELNAVIRELVCKYNNEPMQILKLSRRQLFEQVEKQELKMLPFCKYETKSIARATVAFNYHVYLSEDRHYYSVPYRYRGQKVETLYTETSVDVYFKSERIAFHARNRKIGGYTTLKEHMPASHRFVSEWSYERISSWGDKIGVNAGELLRMIMEKREHPEQGFKSCLGILSLAKKYPDTILDKACLKALSVEGYSFKTVNNIIKNNLFDMSEEDDLFKSHVIAHENIRGREYYSQGGQDE